MREQCSREFSGEISNLLPADEVFPNLEVPSESWSGEIYRGSILQAVVTVLEYFCHKSVKQERLKERHWTCCDKI